MSSTHNLIAILLLSLLLGLPSFGPLSYAQSERPNETLADIIEKNISTINEPRWRNYAYRDLAISLVFAGNTDRGIDIIQQIDNGDTQAMTIRGIGMAMAIHKDLSDTDYKSLFSKLDQSARTIKDEGARDIAYTYIAMAQAFAGLDDDATITTDAMTKPELKYKAFAETAEIQAERGDFNAANKTISHIQSNSFKNKALLTVSKIFTDRKEYDQALKLANMISNPTKKAEALQNIFNAKINLPKKL